MDMFFIVGMEVDFSHLRKLGFEHLSDPLVILLPCALEQGLIGCVLNEYVLKYVG